MPMDDRYNEPPDARRRTGRALAYLRTEAGMTQPQAAEAAGISLQAWQNYEYGRRQFTRGLIERVTQAVGKTVADLERAFDVVRVPALVPPPMLRSTPYDVPLVGRVRAGPQGFHVYDGGEPEMKDLAEYFATDVFALRVTGDSMIPYVEAGGFVTYSTRDPVRRNRGCVVRLKDGTFFVKRFDHIRDGVLQVTEYHPVERALHFPMDEVEGVYPVGLRAD